MTEDLGKMDAQAMLEIALDALEKAREKGQTPEASMTIRMINDLAYWLEDTLLKFALAEKLIRIYYREEQGILPANFEAWRKIRDGDDYKPKIHLV
jgi:hypothetical protein